MTTSTPLIAEQNELLEDLRNQLATAEEQPAIPDLVELERLSRYESALDRQLHRALRELRQLQKQSQQPATPKTGDLTTPHPFAEEQLRQNEPTIDQDQESADLALLPGIQLPDQATAAETDPEEKLRKCLQIAAQNAEVLCQYARETDDDDLYDPDDEATNPITQPPTENEKTNPTTIVADQAA